MTVLIIVHSLICIFLVLVILLQPGKGDGGIGFGAASSSSQSIFGSRGAGNFLTKMTTACAVLFIFTSFLLTRKNMKENTSSVITETEQTAPATPGQTPPTPATAPAQNQDKAAEKK